MKGDEDRCPYCGAPAKFAWDGSNYEDISDVLMQETGHYTCGKCNSRFTILTMYKIVGKKVLKGYR